MMDGNNFDTCLSCGKPYKTGARFCPNCGRAIEFESWTSHSESETQLLCSECHTPLQPEAFYCLNCGKAVSEMPDGGIVVIPPEPPDDGDDFPHRSYGTLNFLSILLWVAGILIILLGLMAGIGAANTINLEGLVAFVVIAGGIVFSTGIAVIFFAAAEFIRLLIDMEDNQRWQIKALAEIIDLLPK